MENGESSDVLLISPPWCQLNSPSIQLSILKSAVRQKGFECYVLYANLLLAKHIAPEFYKRIQNTAFLGEWLFSRAVFGNYDAEGMSDFLDYFNSQAEAPELDNSASQGRSSKRVSFLEGSFGKSFRNVIENMRNEAVPAYLSRMREVFDRYKRIRIVGFTTTFSQNLPSIALARIIKEEFRDKIIVLGGANCEGVMGPALLRAFPIIDYVVSGEGEETFPFLLEGLHSHDDELLRGLRGISYRDGTGVHSNPPAEPIRDLDKYPIMDCDDYYWQLQELQKECALEIERGPIYFECSRGCWWGQHTHCTFCGLNGLNMNFRSKSTERVIRELAHLSKRYKTLSFWATDNILNPAHFITLLPKLRDAGFDFRLFFELKANMQKQHVKILAQSGATDVQPGFESLSTHVLKLMRKGTTMLQNIQTLKWMEEYGIDPNWNLVGGSPHETEDDYLLLERVIPLLYHLPPPIYPFRRLLMHRFSPNFDFAEELGFKNVVPKKHYKYIFDLSDDLLRDIAYWFDYELPGYEKFVPHVKRIQHLLEEWNTKYHSDLVELSYGRGPDFVEVEDTRYGSRKHKVLSGCEMEILLCCDRISSLDMILEWLRNRNAPFNENDVTFSIEALIADGLIIAEDEKYLSLATAKNPDLEMQHK